MLENGLIAGVAKHPMPGVHGSSHNMGFRHEGDLGHYP